MPLLAIVPEAFGGFGGIAVYNRDFLTALAELKLCEKMTVLPRLIRQERGALPRPIELIENAANSRVRWQGVAGVKFTRRSVGAPSNAEQDRLRHANRLVAKE